MQYIVNESDIDKRKEFYDYVVNNYSLEVHSSMERMIDSSFPFIIDFDQGTFWVCGSITCLACAAQRKRIITIDKFKERV